MAEYIQLLGNICLVPCDAKMFMRDSHSFKR